VVVVLEHNISTTRKEAVRSFLEGHGHRVREIRGEQETIFGAVGLPTVDIREVEVLPGVARVIPITSPYKLASREFRKADTEIQVGPVRIGGPRIVVIAGPCAVESREQILAVARRVRESGAVILRGGAYKPRTSPYAFQGLAEEGLRYLREAGDATGMPVVSEIVSPEHADVMKELVDILQIGARNMQNFELLKRVGELGKPVLLKRGLAATIQDLLMSAEYLLAHGTDAVILCERGIRTFETATRNTLDLSAIPVVQKLSHLPIFVDPSHGTGIREKVLPMARAAVAAGAQGITCEVHLDPDRALSDGPQSLYPEQFEKLMRDIEALAPVLERELVTLPQAEAKTARATRAVEIRGSGPTRVAYQGERGAFSHKAMLRHFHGEVEPVSKTEFREIFESVLDGSSEYGVVPIENSLTGSIHQNYDLILQFPDVRIVGEQKIRIVHNLIGLPGASIADIRRLYSHPQALAQCGRFLEGYPAWEKVSYYDTAGSVALIAQKADPTNAAIASEEAAAVHGMKILKPSIETYVQNYTRFFIIARAGAESARPAGGAGEDSGPRKASFVMSTPDKPGALAEALTLLASRGVNLKKLESRPIPEKPWEYLFYMDVDVPEDRERFESALRDMETMSAAGGYYRLLGEYPA
jgi:3-deoxy-7-phosphoheptulonate synthase